MRLSTREPSLLLGLHRMFPSSFASRTIDTEGPDLNPQLPPVSLEFDLDCGTHIQLSLVSLLCASIVPSRQAQVRDLGPIEPVWSIHGVRAIFAGQHLSQGYANGTF